MNTELTRLGSELCRPRVRTIPEGLDLEIECARTIVVIPAGGFGYRMRDVAAEAGGVTQKSLLPLPNGETLIDRVVRQYAAAGYRDFVALVNHAGAEVERHVGSGATWGVSIRCSYDPEGSGSGRTGAMLHAMHQGILPRDRPLIVHNADCQVVRYPGDFPRDLLSAHRAAATVNGSIATLAVVPGTPYPFTGLSVRDGMVHDVEMYPFIPVPTHTGITALEPEALSVIEERAGVSAKNFEADLFPVWAEARRLAALVIPHDQWFAVDDRKAFRQCCEAIEEEIR
jgi:NDP-sugar pyrophosphorylase family protein